MPRLPRRLALAAGPFVLLAALLLISGCGNKVIGIPPEPPPPTAPPANSDSAAVQRLVWCWNNRDTTGLQDLFTADYVFTSAPLDSGSSGWSWFREQELLSSRHLFVDGTGSMLPATFITLIVDPTLISTPDSRPGHDRKWHREIYTAVQLGIRTASSEFYAADHARFFVVRGDSAKIPQVLKDRGVQPDSTRWWIDGWDDVTNGVVVTNGSQSSSEMSFARIKALYLPEPTPPTAVIARAAPAARPNSSRSRRF